MRVVRNQFVFIGVCLTLLLGGIVYWGVRDGKNSEVDVPLSQTGMVFYWGDGCPHCKTVEDKLEQYHVSDKIDFERKEVWNDKKNAKEMEQRASACGIKTSEIGVPFLFSDGKCFVGEPDVEKEFFMRAGLWDESTNQPIPAD